MFIVHTIVVDVQYVHIAASNTIQCCILYKQCSVHHGNPDSYKSDEYCFQLEVGALTVPLPVEFCGVQFNGCVGASPR